MKYIVTMVRHNEKTRRFDYTYKTFVGADADAAIKFMMEQKATCHQAMVGTQKNRSNVLYMGERSCGAAVPTSHEYPVGFFNG